MENVIKDILLIQSFNLDDLIEDYRIFFLAIIPSMFVLASLIEYFDRMNAFALLKRGVISVLILSTVTSFYKVSIDASMEAANEKLRDQKLSNILLMDMFGALTSWDSLSANKTEHNFNKDGGAFSKTLGFFKYHLFDRFINDGFTIVVFFVCKICFVILKVVYSLVYYLGYGLVGVPCLIYLFPTMGNVLRGGILSYLWCLVVPHVLVFILSMIGTEINKGYVSGQIIGGSAMGTALLFVMSLFLAFTPMITAMILNGSGISQAGGIIATLGGNFVMNLPKQSLNAGAMMLSGAALGPKMKLAKGLIQGVSQTASSIGYKAHSKAQGMFQNGFNSSKPTSAIKNEASPVSNQAVSSFVKNLIGEYLQSSQSVNNGGFKTSASSLVNSNMETSRGTNTSSKNSPKFLLGSTSNLASSTQTSNGSVNTQKLSQSNRKESGQVRINSKSNVDNRRKDAKISRPIRRNPKDKIAY
jgi:hypothetical protein